MGVEYRADGPLDNLQIRPLPPEDLKEEAREIKKLVVRFEEALVALVELASGDPALTAHEDNRQALEDIPFETIVIVESVDNASGTFSVITREAIPRTLVLKRTGFAPITGQACEVFEREGEKSVRPVMPTR